MSAQDELKLCLHGLKVRASSIPTVLQKISIPLKVEEWKRALLGHPDEDRVGYVLAGIRMASGWGSTIQSTPVLAPRLASSLRGSRRFYNAWPSPQWEVQEGSGRSPGVV